MNHLLLPYSHPYAFFDILFMARNVESTESKKLTLNLRKKIVNKYINFVKLGEIMERKRSGSPEDQAQYREWVSFLALFGTNPNLADIKIDNELQLIAFIRSCLIFRDKRLNRIPSDLTNSIKEGKGYYVDPSKYDIDPEFHKALYLDGYIK